MGCFAALSMTSTGALLPRVMLSVAKRSRSIFTQMAMRNISYSITRLAYSILTILRVRVCSSTCKRYT